MKKLNKVLLVLKSNKKKFLLLFIVIAVLFSYRLFKNDKPKSFNTVHAVNKDIVSNISASGIVVARNQASLHFQTAGKLIWLGAKKGDKVYQWQALAKLDSREVEKNLIKALRDFSKERNDFEEDKQQTYKFVALNDTIKRILEKNQWDLEKAVLDVEIKTLSVELSTLYSPLDGIVTSSDMNVAGINILASDDITITDPSSVYFQGEVDELDISRINIDQDAQITFDSYPSEEISARVTGIAFTAMTTDAGGTAYTVDLSLPDNQNLKFKSGMNGDALIHTQTKNNILSVPIESVFEEEGKSFVYLLENGKPVKQQVSVGLEGENDIEIVSGLVANQQVVLNPTEVKTK